MDVSVSVVSYNSARHIVRCLDSVLSQTGVSLEVFVVDNASGDDTVERLEAYGNSIQVIRNVSNVGFGRAHNQSLARARGRFFYALNPDAWLVQADMLSVLLRILEQSLDVALLTTRVEGHVEPPVEFLYPGERYLRDPLPPLPGEIAWVLGANMFLRKDFLDAVGGFDESFFLYSEETDLCLRLRKAGYKIECVSELSIGHVGGASEEGSVSGAVWRRKTEGLYLFYRKHYTPRDFQRLLRRDRARARFRLWLASLGVYRNRGAARVEKYSAIREIATEHLNRITT